MQEIAHQFELRLSQSSDLESIYISLSRLSLGITGVGQGLACAESRVVSLLCILVIAPLAWFSCGGHDDTIITHPDMT